MPDTATLSTPLAYALAYAAIGWHVLPLEPNAKQPLGRLVPRGMLDATTDAATIRQWWGKVPSAGIGIALAPSGLVAIDVDPRNGGTATFDDLQAAHGSLRSEVMALTGGGGEHHVFVVPPGHQVNLPGTLGPGVDLKANGYIVVEPSLHPSGKAYAWEWSSNPLDGVAPSPLPDWLRSLRVDLHRPRTDPAAKPVDARQAADVREALFVLEADDYDTWIKAGMALHATGWGHPAYAIWCAWSQQSPKFDATVQRHKWESFSAERDQALTLRWVFAEAQRAGWRNPAAAPARVSAVPAAQATRLTTGEDGATVVVTGEGEAVRTWADAVRDWQPPADLMSRSTEVEWDVEGWIQRAKVGALVAAGGTGKTTLLLTLGICVALGRPWFGQRVRRGTFLLLSNDDPQEDIEAALVMVMRAMKLDEREVAQVSRGLRIVSLIGKFGERVFTQTTASAVSATQMLELLLQATEQIDDLAMVALDTLRQFAGGSTNDEQVIRLTVGACTEFANLRRATVILPHHTGKQNYREKVVDMYAGSGSAAIADNCRFILLLQEASWEEINTKVDRTGNEQGNPLVLTSTRGSLRVKTPDPMYLTREGYRIERIGGQVRSQDAIEDAKDRKVLEAVRNGAQSKNAVHAAVGGRKTACLERVDLLIGKGFLEESGSGSGRRSGTALVLTVRGAKLLNGL